MKNNLFLPPQLNNEIYLSARICSMLNKSLQLHHATYIQGIAGMGKTSLIATWIVKYKLKNIYEVYWIDCEVITNELLQELARSLSSRKMTSLLIWDNYEKVAFGEMDKLIVQITEQLGVKSRTIFITKGKVPDYIYSGVASHQINLISGLELILTEQEMKEYIHVFKGCDMPLDTFIKPDLFPAMPVTLNLMVLQYEKLNRGFPEVLQHVRDQLFWHLKTVTIDTWTKEEYDFIKRVYPYEIINKKVLQNLYGNTEKYRILLQFAQDNCYLMRIEGDSFVFTEYIHSYLQRAFSIVLEEEEYLQVNLDAIQYYENEQDYEKVTALYLDINFHKEALTSLIELHRINKLRPFHSKYEHYYKSIPDQVVAYNPEAVFWCMVDCLAKFDVNGFTKWYKIFICRYTSSSLTAEQWTRADMTYTYIKLLSPFTTVDEFLTIAEKSRGRYTMDDVAKVVFEYEEMDMITFLLLRRWRLQDGIERFRDDVILEEFLGRRFYSILMVYLGVCYFNASRMEDAYICLRKGTDGCRFYGLYGPELFGESYLYDQKHNSYALKKDVLDRKEPILKKLANRKEHLKVVESFQIKMWLFQNDIDKISVWMSEHKSCLSDTHSLLNYKSLLQLIRVQIYVDNLYDAQLILEEMLRNFESYHFEEDKIECNILYSIICYRKGSLDDAVQYFLKAYWLAKSNELNRIIIDEGIAIQPVLNTVISRLPSMGREEDIQYIITKVSERAKSYSSYLQSKTKQKDLLTKTEKEILKELDSGNTLIQIADKRCISLNTVKQHTKTIYSKLKVNKRNMAIKVAKERGLI